MSTSDSTESAHRPYDQVSLPAEYHGFEFSNIASWEIPFMNGHLYFVFSYVGNLDAPREILHCGFYLCRCGDTGEGTLWHLRKAQETGWEWKVSKTEFGPDTDKFMEGTKNLAFARYLFEVNSNDWDRLDAVIQSVEVQQSEDSESWMKAVHEKLKETNHTFRHPLDITNDEVHRLIVDAYARKEGLLIAKGGAASNWKLPLNEARRDF